MIMSNTDQLMKASSPERVGRWMWIEQTIATAQTRSNTIDTTTDGWTSKYDDQINPTAGAGTPMKPELLPV
jgi:hypothetical protein